MSGTGVPLRRHVAWQLFVLALLDVLLFGATGTLFGEPALDFQDLTRVGYLKALLLPAAPLLGLVIQGILPSGAKDALLFWRIRNALPGHEAFSVHLHADPRINVGQLKKKLGALPVDGPEQNALWYSLYRKHEGAPQVIDVHRVFLVARDAAVLSLLLLLAAIASAVAGWSGKRSLLLACLALLQYVVFALVGRNAGVRFVRSVLALEASAPKRAG